MIVLPVPMNVPPQEPENHCVEVLPPMAVNVVDLPEQIELLPVMPEGAEVGVPETLPTVMN